jgi:hypothetical protein
VRNFSRIRAHFFAGTLWRGFGQFDGGSAQIVHGAALELPGKAVQRLQHLTRVELADAGRWFAFRCHRH